VFKARQQSTTSYPVLIYMVLSSDHVTPATGKTLTVTLSKNGGAFASASGAVSELANGWYSFAGNATDRNTLGSLAIRATATACDDANLTIEIVPYDPFARLDANVTYWNGSAVATPDTAGHPKVTIKDGTGQGELDITSGAVATTGGGSLTAADVWTYATRTLTSGPAIVNDDLSYEEWTIVRGNSYSSSNQPKTFTLTTGPTDLSTYTWAFTADKDADNLNSGDATFTGSVTVTTATGASRAVRVDVPATTTDTLAIGRYTGHIRGTSGSDKATPKIVAVTVVDDSNEA
jgi:hypothetical protein